MRTLGGKNILNTSSLIVNESLIQDERLSYLMEKVIERKHLSSQWESTTILNDFCEVRQIKLEVLDREIDILLRNYILLH